MKGHRVQTVLTSDSTAVGICSCGYVGPDRANRSLAALDSNKHLVDSARAGTDPRQIAMALDRHKTDDPPTRVKDKT